MIHSRSFVFFLIAAIQLTAASALTARQSVLGLWPVASLQNPPRQPDGGVVTGILRTRAGTPLEGVRIAATPATGGLAQTDALVLESLSLTDKLGRYRLEGVAAGRYHIVVGRVDSPLYHPLVPEVERATTISVVAGQTTEVPEMVFQTATVAGRVIDAITGQPRRISSLALCCDRLSMGTLAGTGFGVIFSSTSIRARMNEDGTFVIPEVPPGHYSLEASDPGIVPMIQILSVGAAGDISGLDVRVTAGVEVRGQVVDRLGQRTGGVQIVLKPDANNAVLERTALAPLASASSFTTSPVTALSLQSLYTMDQVRRGIDSAAKPRMVPVAADGTFALPRVLPGKYVLEMQAPGQAVFGKEIQVGVRDDVETQLALPFTRVSGRILDEDGKSIPSLSGSIRLIPSDPDMRMLFGFPDGEGLFSILMAPGEYRLFTDLLSVDRDIVSVSDGIVDLRSRPFVFDGGQREIRITVAK